MKDIGIIGSSDGPTAIYVDSEDMTIARERPPTEKEYLTVEEKLDAKTLPENLNSGFKIMGLGMVAVFGVLTALYIVVKIMGMFAKTNKDKDSSNEKN